MPASIEELLARHDLQLLGVADTAFAFAPPDDRSLAIKIGFDPDDGWPAWAGWCSRNPGPHVPRIVACDWITVAGRPRLFVAAIERLYPTLVGSRWIKACPAGKRDPLRFADHVEGTHRSIAAMLRAAGAAFPGAHWDMGGPNWLEREHGTIVLNDPISRLTP